MGQELPKVTSSKASLHMIRRLIVFAILSLVGASAYAQVDTAWVRRYNGPGNSSDDAPALTVDTCGNVYVTGSSYGGSGTSNDCATIKYLPDGDTAWLRRYTGPGAGTDIASDVAVDNGGNVCVTGYSDQDAGSTINTDYITIKYDQNGVPLWVRFYSGPANLSDGAVAVAVDSSGNVFVTGWSTPYSVNYDYATIKYDSDGTQLWARRYNGPGDGQDTPTGMAIDHAGSVCVTGKCLGSGTSYDYATVKYSSDGTEQWARRYNGTANSSDGAYGIAVDGSGNFIVTGTSYAGATTATDIVTVKYDADGNQVWLRQYNSPASSAEDGRAISVDSYDNIYVTGMSIGSGTQEDFVTIKYYPNGDTAWVRRYNGPENGEDRAYAIAVDASCNAYVTGMRNYSYGVSGDYATVKYDSSGNELWVKTYNGTANNEDLGRDVAVDRFGNVSVTGRSTGTYSYDYATVKYYQNYAPMVISPDSADFLCGADTIRFTVTATDPNADDTLSLSGPGIPTPVQGLSPLSAEASIYVSSSGTYDYVYTVTDSRGATDDDTATWEVTINSLPGPFSLVSPEDSAFVTSAVNFEWESSSDPDPGNDVSYDLFISTSQVFNVDSTEEHVDLVFPAYADTLGVNRYYWKVRANDVCDGTWSTEIFTLQVFQRGDVNADGLIDVGDPIYVLNYLFKSGPEPIPVLAAGDANCDEIVDLGDAIRLLNYLFKAGSAPCED